MNKRQKVVIITIVALIIGSLGMLIYCSNAYKPVPYDMQVVDNDATNNEETRGKNIEGAENSKEKNADMEEKTLEEKEREIESKKPRDKITVDLLKDTSNATVDDTLETLPDAPLFYRVDGIEYKLKESPEIIEKPTKILTEEDIKRLQNYGYNWHTGYVEKVPPKARCGEYYEKHPKDTKWAVENLYPQRLDVFRNGIVGWVTGSDLVYKTAKAYYGMRGILQLSYLRENNMYDLEPYKLYERDAEFRYANTTDGLFLRQVVYLSDWKEVEKWGNPYK